MPDALTRLYCERCGLYRDGPGVRQVQSGRGFLPSCVVCGDALHHEAQRVSEPYPKVLLRAFLFPFQPWLLVTLAVAGVVISFARFVPVFGAAFSATIVLSLIFAIIRATAAGRDDLGLEGVDTSLAGWFHPVIRYLLTLLVAFGPAAVLALKLGYPEGAHVVLPALALGVVYLPAGIVVAAHNEGCVAPLNPIVGVQLIARIPGPYFVTLGFLALASLITVAMQLAIGALHHALSGIAFLATMFAISASLVGPVVMARMLGLLLREHGDGI